MSEIRLLRNDDISSIMRLNQAAGWNQTEADWARLIRLQPDGCFGLEVDGEVLATTTAYCYGSDLAWIGMVLTDPAHRGHGYARRLMEHALQWLEQREIQWIKLDATDMGHPLYSRLGFEDESIVERWRLEGRGGSPEPGPAPKRAPLPFSLDRAAFGADRTALLNDLSACEYRILGDAAYALGRAGVNGAYFGPCVTNSAGDARTLLQWFIGTHANEPVFWDILPENEAALDLAQEFGFERRRRLMRQVRPGVSRPARFKRIDQYVFAIAGFEYG